jgi:hypothetical protein
MSPKPGAKGHFGKLFRVINQHVNKLGIPVGIIKSAALAMNLIPVPSARRCYRLGQALRRAIESFPEDINVAIVAIRQGSFR